MELLKLNNEILAIIGGEQKHQAVKTDGVCTCLCSSMGSGGGYVPMIALKRLGNLYGEDRGTGYAGNVWDKNGLSPTIETCQGGNRQPMIVEDKKICAMRGRNPENPSDRTKGIKTEQRLELNEQNISNTLTSVQKDNLLLEKRVFEQAIETLENNDCENGDLINAYNKKVNKTGVCPTRPEGFKTSILPVESKYRIRKLTPLETSRLMGIKDSDYKKMETVGSNSALYKQHGNSICISVLMAMFRNLNIKGVKNWNEVKDNFDMYKNYVFDCPDVKSR